MSEDEKIPNWILWIWEHFSGVLLASLLVATVTISAVYVENRVADIENQLNYAPARSYAPPNLATYDAGDARAEELASRHLVYVPVYSHIYYRGGSPCPLETTLSIRNVDADRSIFVESVEYYDTTGKLAKTHVDRLIKLAPLETIEFLIEGRDSSGGSGANFLIWWGAKSEVDKPMIETIMVGATGAQGVSFGRSGTEISLRDSSDE